MLFADENSTFPPKLRIKNSSDVQKKKNDKYMRVILW